MRAGRGRETQSRAIVHLLLSTSCFYYAPQAAPAREWPPLAVCPTALRTCRPCAIAPPWVPLAPTRHPSSPQRRSSKISVAPRREAAWRVPPSPRSPPSPRLRNKGHMSDPGTVPPPRRRNDRFAATTEDLVVDVSSQFQKVGKKRPPKGLHERLSRGSGGSSRRPLSSEAKGKAPAQARSSKFGDRAENRRPFGNTRGSSQGATARAGAERRRIPSGRAALSRESVGSEAKSSARNSRPVRLSKTVSRDSEPDGKPARLSLVDYESEGGPGADQRGRFFAGDASTRAPTSASSRPVRRTISPTRRGHEESKRNSFDDGPGLRARGNSTASLQEGDAVEARYRGGSKWYPGKIARERRDGTFDIAYDDGEREDAVASRNVRAVRGAAARGAQGAQGRDRDARRGRQQDLSDASMDEGGARDKLRADAVERYRGGSKWIPARSRASVRHRLRRRRARGRGGEPQRRAVRDRARRARRDRDARRGRQQDLTSPAWTTASATSFARRRRC